MAENLTVRELQHIIWPAAEAWFNDRELTALQVLLTIARRAEWDGKTTVDVAKEEFNAQPRQPPLE